MILSDTQIRRALDTGRVVIDPSPREDQFAPSAVDLHVGEQFRAWKPMPSAHRRTIRLSEINLPDCAELMEELPREPDGGVVIEPGQFVLSSTLERVGLPIDSRLAARVEGRSSYARLGLVVHMTAPTIHAGFEGQVVLEIMNFGPYPLQLDPRRTHICQVIFEELGEDPTIAINTVFQGQSDVLGAPPRP
jgi:dCTP deaminase